MEKNRRSLVEVMDNSVFKRIAEKNIDWEDKDVQKKYMIGFSPALSVFMTHASGAGFTNVVIDNDGTRRRVELLSNCYGRNVAQLSFAPLLGLLKVEGLETAFAVVGAEKVELYSSIMKVVGIFTRETTFAFDNYLLLAQCCLAIGAALLAITFILSLISITRKKLPLFARILVILALLFTAGSIVLLAFFTEGATLGLSCYVLGGLMLLIFIISLCGKSNKTKSKKRGRGRK